MRGAPFFRVLCGRVGREDASVGRTFLSAAFDFKPPNGGSLRLQMFGKNSVIPTEAKRSAGTWCFGLAYRVGRTLLSAAFDPRLLSLTPAKQRSRQEVPVILERSEGPMHSARSAGPRSAQ